MNTKFHFSLTALTLPAFGLALGMSLACPAIVCAQQPLPYRTPGAAAPYLLGPDDVLSIQVLNFPELSVAQVTVPSDGQITVPVLGALPVAGRTTEQVAQTLKTRWSEYYNGVFVTVTLTQRRHQSVQVYGFVTHPEPVDFQPDLHLMAALAAAGGAAENGDLTQVTVTRQGGQAQTVDVSNPQTASGTAQDLLLAPNDVVFVPERHMQVSVTGEVAKPGSFDYKDKMTVLDALTDADNVNIATADLSGATLTHDGKTQPLDLKGLLVGGQMADNLPLAPGDSINIPLLNNRIYVDGAVKSAGYYAFKPGDRLLNAISGSGGTIAGVSDLMKVTVVHQDKVHNVVVAQTVDFGKFLQHGDMSVNLPLQPDDAIYVPVKGASGGWLGPLGTIIGISSSTRVLTGH